MSCFTIKKSKRKPDCSLANLSGCAQNHSYSTQMCEPSSNTNSGEKAFHYMWFTNGHTALLSIVNNHKGVVECIVLYCIVLCGYRRLYSRLLWEVRLLSLQLVFFWYIVITNLRANKTKLSSLSRRQEDS